MRKLLFVIALWSAVIGYAFAASHVQVETLVKGAHSWDGEHFFYHSGQAEMTVVSIMVGEGARIPSHCHPVPLAAYVESGAIEVTKGDGTKRQFNAGEAFIEVMNAWHSGYGAKADTKLIVFYAGTEGVPLSVNDQSDSQYVKACL